MNVKQEQSIFTSKKIIQLNKSYIILQNGKYNHDHNVDLVITGQINIQYTENLKRNLSSFFKVFNLIHYNSFKRPEDDLKNSHYEVDQLKVTIE